MCLCFQSLFEYASPSPLLYDCMVLYCTGRPLYDVCSYVNQESKQNAAIVSTTRFFWLLCPTSYSVSISDYADFVPFIAEKWLLYIASELACISSHWRWQDLASAIRIILKSALHACTGHSPTYCFLYSDNACLNCTGNFMTALLLRFPRVVSWGYPACKYCKDMLLLYVMLALVSLSMRKKTNVCICVQCQWMRRGGKY